MFSSRRLGGHRPKGSFCRRVRNIASASSLFSLLKLFTVSQSEILAVAARLWETPQLPVKTGTLACCAATKLADKIILWQPSSSPGGTVRMLIIWCAAYRQSYVRSRPPDSVITIRQRAVVFIENSCVGISNMATMCSKFIQAAPLVFRATSSR